MNEVTQLLNAIEAGDPKAASELLPLVYQELRQLASRELADERAGQTLQATALVHEAYLRLVGPGNADGFTSRHHFFAAAAQAMRRILVELARRKKREKHGGQMRKVDWETVLRRAHTPEPDETLALDEALEQLKEIDPDAASLVELRFFIGLPMSEAAEVLNLPLRSAERTWTFARTWLHRKLTNDSDL